MEYEMLPVNAVGPGLLKVNAAGTNASPMQLLAIEHAPKGGGNDPWRMDEVRRSKSGLRSQDSSIYSIASMRATAKATVAEMPTVAEVTPVALAKPEPSDLSWRASLGSKESYVWARFRDWLGQPRSLNPSLALHGLRPFPFMYQFSIMCIIVEVTWSLVTLLLGNGYVRGLCPAPEPAPLRILGFVYSSVPLQCE